jgi:zinc protease
MRIPLIAATTLGLVWGLEAQTAPEEPPAPGPVTPLGLPQPQQVLLPNGLRLVVLEQHRQPVVSIRLSLPAGSAFDPAGKEGLADLYAAMLTRGAGPRSGLGFATAVEDVGGTMGASAGPDHLLVQADVVSAHAALAFELIADVILRPTLDAGELEGVRQHTLNAIASGLEDPGSLAARVFLLATYRSHPYGRRPSPQSVQAITRADLDAFRRGRVRPTGSVLVVAGDITLAEARRLATQSLSAWKGLRPSPLPAVPPAASPREILLVHAGGIPDANILIGSTTFAGADTGYYAAALLSQILGVGPGSRLAEALATGHSWPAAFGASYLRTARLGLFQASATVSAVAADSALRAMYAEAARLRTALVSANELDRARESLAGAYALRLQTMSQVAGAFTESQLLGLPARSLSTHRARILGVTATQVRAMARRVLPARGMVSVVVGDAARLYRPLSEVGTVRIFAVDGRPLSPEAVEPKPVPLTLVPSQAAARVDSLAILADGRTVGMQVTRLTPAGDSLTYVEETVLGTMLSQTTTLTFDTAGRMRSLDQSGKARGQDTRIQLKYGTGRVRGTALVAAGDGPRTIAVDTAVSDGIVDDNGIQALLPLLRWDINVRWAFDVFASGENVIRRLTLTAADLTRVSVPAGTFDCYRADLEGGTQRVSFFVASKPPHRVIRVEIANSPIEFIAVNP